MRRLVASALLAVWPVWGAAITAVRNGYWDVANGDAGANPRSPWCSSGTCTIPGAGDTVDLSTYAVTVRDTRYVGISGSYSKSGPVINFSQTTSGSGYTGASACSATFGPGPVITAAASCAISGDGVVVTLTDGGGGYSTSPTLTVACTGCSGTPTPPTFSFGVNGGGTPAIVKTNAGKLIPAPGARLYVSGDYLALGSVNSGPDNMIEIGDSVSGDAHVYFDHTSAPAGVHYWMGRDGSLAGPLTKTALSCKGTKAAPSSIEGIGTYFIYGDQGSQNYPGGRSVLSYCNPVLAGGPGWSARRRGEPFTASRPWSGYGAGYTNIPWDHVVCDRCGPVDGNRQTSVEASVLFTLDRVAFKNSTAVVTNFYADSNVAPTANHALNLSVFDVGAWDTTNFTNGFYVTGNYLAKSRPSTATGTLRGVWNDNLWVESDCSVNAPNGPGNLTNNIMYSRHDGDCHFAPSPKSNGAAAYTHTGNISDGDTQSGSVAAQQIDWMPVMEDVTHTNSHVFIGNLQAPGTSAGNSQGELGVRRTLGVNEKVQYLYNLGYPQDLGETFQIFDGQVNGNAHTVTDLAYNATIGLPGVTTATTANQMNWGAGTLADFIDPAGVVGNVAWQIGTTIRATDGSLPWVNSGNSYILPWSVTPSILNVDPRPLDPSRNVMSFWGAYLGSTPTRHWQTATAGTAMAVDDTVSYASTVYVGQMIYLHCIKAHNKGDAGTNPFESTGAWRQYWEPATFKWIRDRLEDGARGNDYVNRDSAIDCQFGCTPVQTVHNWIMKGAAFQNPRVQCPRVGPYDYCGQAKVTLAAMMM